MKRIFSILTLALFCAASFAQTVTLTFTGRDGNNRRVQLDRVVITNLTRSWQETIMWPDTTLTMQNGVGIVENGTNGGFSLSQNNPNPFDGTTSTALTTAEAGAVALEITDVNGRLVSAQNFASLQPGTHQFRISVASAGTYVLTARQSGKVTSVKMVNNGNGAADGIDYQGMANESFQLKNGAKGNTNNPFAFGDQMEYVGYATINGNEEESARITQQQSASQLFTLQFTSAQAQLATVTTAAATNIAQTSATCGGSVVTDGGSTVIDRGVCYNTTGTPTISDQCLHIGTDTGAFSDNLTGLTSETTYYVRAYAINGVGISYGPTISFTTYSDSIEGQPCPGAATVTDVDNNTYITVLIGTQCWMKENLKTTKYADGTAISNGATTAYWYYPNNDTSNKATYGLLYNWKAVMHNSSSSSGNPSGVQGICPTGWHVPSDAEWSQLTDYVSSQSQFRCSGNSSNIAKALASTYGWTSYPGSNSNKECYPGYQQGSNNSAGFSVLPAGFYSTSYVNFGISTLFWSATESSSTNAYLCFLRYDNATVNRGHDNKTSGYSVRCVRD